MKTNRARIIVSMILSCAIFLLVGLSLPFGRSVANAEERAPWTKPIRLSSWQGEATEGNLVADPFGNVHLFWAENGFDDKRAVIKYSRYDGTRWTVPVAVYASWPGTQISFVSPAVDNKGIIHLAWSEGVSGPILYMTVPINDAFSATNWSPPSRVNLDALKIKLLVDSTGVVHLLYASFYGDQPGIYHTETMNGGKSWTYPNWLDPDIPKNAAPSWLDATLDAQDGIHVVWSYGDKNQGLISRWVRYSRSIDGGQSWSRPFSIDYASKTVDELRLPNPSIATSGYDVHVVWAGTADTNREHRYSTDRGRTWSDIEPVFGDLLGQAIGDGLAVDSGGTIHFVGQLRYPMAIYHFSWFDGKWSDPEIAYFIKKGAKDDVKGNVGAHNVRLAVRSGNELVMTFTTGPQDPQSVLYAMTRPLEDVNSVQPLYTPTASPYPTTTPIPVTSVPTITPPPPDLGEAPMDADPNVLGQPIWFGLAPALAFVVLFLAIRLVRHR